MWYQDEVYNYRRIVFKLEYRALMNTLNYLLISNNSEFGDWANAAINAFMNTCLSV